MDFKSVLKDQGLATTEKEIKAKFNELTAKEGFITNTTEISPFWRLISAIAVKPLSYIIDFLTVEIMPNLFIKTAKGAFLDLMVQGAG